jgi:putative membrane protein
MGTVAMALGTIEYWYRLQELRQQNSFAIWRPSFIMALLMSATGLFMFIAIIAKAL